MVKKEIVPTPAPARITVGEKILARMDEVLSHVSGQEDRLKVLEYRIDDLGAQIRRMDETLLAFDEVLAKMQEDTNATRNSAEAAEAAAEQAYTEIGDIANAIPDVNEIVDTLRRQERLEWLTSTKPAF